MSRLWKHRATALFAASIGAAVFRALHLPLPLLLGPMAGCLLFALAGVPLAGMGTLGLVMRTFLGVVIGSTVTPELLHELPGYGPTLLLIPLFVLVTGMAGYPFFRWGMGFNHPTSFYSAMPGGLQDMLIFGEEAGGDVRAMSLIHATRVLVIVAVVPFVLAHLYDLDLTRAPGVRASALPASQIVIMVIAGIVGWRLAERVGLFGASILGPLIVAAILSLAGIIQSRPPAEMIWAAQFFIGIAVGAKYSGITAKEIRIDVGAGLVYCAILAAVSIAVIWAVMQLTNREPLDLMLAFLPGGQSEMAVIAIVAEADVGFVVAHHLLRIFIVIISAPVIARMIRQ
jgi:membrane AbrB-like protein